MLEVTCKCNKCGVKGYARYDMDSQGEYLHEFETQAGYGSLYDDETITIHLCDDCLKEVMKDFKYHPINYKGGES